MKNNVYNDCVTKYARDERFLGEIKQPDFCAELSNSACGDRIKITGVLVDGCIKEIKYVGVGCMISQAAAAMLLEHVSGMSVDDVLRLTVADVTRMLGIELGRVRTKCAQLPLDVLHDALRVQ
jgi:nitrogen fixation protein NifU and related proteins